MTPLDGTVFFRAARHACHSALRERCSGWTKEFRATRILAIRRAERAGVALGSGDIDCVYHFALPELVDTVRELGLSDSEESLKIMVSGKRLKDISDLPLDLAV